MDAVNRSYPGIAPDDPLKPLLDSMADRDDAMSANVAALADAIKGVTILSLDGMARLEQGAATGAARRAAELARAHNRRTLLLGSLAVVIGLAAAVGGGFWWGHTVAADGIQETEQHLALAFQDGPNAAAAWVNLMEQNDVLKALSACKASHAFTDQLGRKACLMPIYPDPPTRPTSVPATR